jgi:hypothetical protein
MANSGEKLRAYFLGELTREEETRLENEYLGDEAKFAQLREAENDLLDDYAHDLLPPTSRKSFEENYLNSPFRIQRLEFAKTLAKHQKTKSEAVQTDENKAFAWLDIFSFWKTGAAFAALLLLVIGGMWLMKTTPNLPDKEIALSETPQVFLPPTPQATAKTEKTPIKPKTNINGASANVLPTPKPGVSPTPDEIKPNQTIVLALSAVGMRDGGKINQAIIGKETKTLVLQLSLTETEAKVFQVNITNADGESVYQIKNARAAGKNVRLNLPANLLKTDDYLIEISAINPGGETEKVSSYSFRITKK